MRQSSSPDFRQQYNALFRVSLFPASYYHYFIIIIIIIIHIYVAHYSHCALLRFLKNPVIPLLNTHRSYTEKIESFKSFFNIVMESAL